MKIIERLSMSMENKIAKIYTDGTYFDNYPTWHVEDSPWKAKQIKKIIEDNALNPNKFCEIGCGAGEILNQLSGHYPGKEFYGYELSPQAFELCRKKSKTNLTFMHSDLLEEKSKYYDIVMAIDVFEHVDDCLGFLRKLREKGEYKIFHIPLDLSVQTVFRSSPIIKGRKIAGHIHCFTKETALETLNDAGYEIVDYFYTGVSLELPNRGWKRNLLKIPRKIGFIINKDLTVRILGGYALLVLAK